MAWFKNLFAKNKNASASEKDPQSPMIEKLNQENPAFKRTKLVSQQEDNLGSVCLSLADRGLVFDIKNRDGEMLSLHINHEYNLGDPDRNGADAYSRDVITPSVGGIVGEKISVDTYRDHHYDIRSLEEGEYKDISKALNDSPLGLIVKNRLFYGESRAFMEKDQYRQSEQKLQESARQAQRNAETTRQQNQQKQNNKVVNEAINKFVTDKSYTDLR